MKYPKSIEKLIKQFMRLPSVGPKTAERYVFQLLQENDAYLLDLATSIIELKKNTVRCEICMSISDANPCATCSDPRRDQSTICVIANTRDLLAIEATKQYHGHYFVLGGLINTIENIGPDKLHINQLLQNIKSREIKEIILALGATLEAETTAMYLAKILKPMNIKITRLARGLSTGANLEYADELTIANALKYRNSI